MNNRPITQEQILELEKVWDVFSLQDKQRVMKLIMASEIYDKTHATLCYEPHEKQMLFHTAPNQGRAIFGGNQSGKTYSGVMEDAMHFTLEYPSWYPQDMRFTAPTVGRIIVKDFPKGVGEVLEPALMRSIHPRHVARAVRNSQGFISKLIGVKGSRLDIITHEMDPMSAEGWQGDWFHMDEPCPRELFVASLRGLIRRAGRWWLSCTPLTEPWMYDEIYTNPKHFCVNVDIRDNPHLSQEQIQVFEDSLTEDEKEARIHGKFMHLSGLCYPEFEASVHVRPSTTIIPPDWPRRLMVDPHDRRPFAMIWAAVDPLNRTWFYREWPLEYFHKMTTSRRSVQDYINLIREAEGSEVIFRRLMDSRFGKQPKMQIEGRDMSDQPNLFDMFDEKGMTFEPSYWTQSLGTSDPGHQAVKQKLRVSPLTEEPSLFVLENCKNLIYAFQHNVWDADKEKQGQFAKDFLDLARFHEMDEPIYFPPPSMDMGRSKWAKGGQLPRHGTFGSEINNG